MFWSQRSVGRRVIRNGSTPLVSSLPSIIPVSSDPKRLLCNRGNHRGEAIVFTEIRFQGKAGEEWLRDSLLPRLPDQGQPQVLLGSQIYFARGVRER